MCSSITQQLSNSGCSAQVMNFLNALCLSPAKPGKWGKVFNMMICLETQFEFSEKRGDDLAANIGDKTLFAISSLIGEIKISKNNMAKQILQLI